MISWVLAVDLGGRLRPKLILRLHILKLRHTLRMSVSIISNKVTTGWVVESTLTLWRVQLRVSILVDAWSKLLILKLKILRNRSIRIITILNSVTKTHKRQVVLLHIFWILNEFLWLVVIEMGAVSAFCMRAVSLLTTPRHLIIHHLRILLNSSIIFASFATTNQNGYYKHENEYNQTQS